LPLRAESCRCKWARSWLVSTHCSLVTCRLPITSARKELGELREAYHRDGQPRPVFELAFRWLAERAPPDPATLADGSANLESPELQRHLWSTTMAKLAVDQPNYATYKRALAQDG
jgi:hypothetical protein